MTLRLALAAAAAASFGGRAEACPALAEVSGDGELARVVGELLRARGVDPGGQGDGAERCPEIRARVERRGEAIAVEIVGPGEARIERVVSESATAATVIESFVRADFGAPLLARRAAPPVAPPAAQPVPSREAPPPAHRLHATARGVQLFGGLETSLGTDKTTSMGFQLGVCISLGPLCAAARLRESRVLGGAGRWDNEPIGRESTELLIGLDIPIALGTKTLSPGFAAGLGVIRTEVGEMSGRKVDGSAGLRADVHATLTVPLGRRLALDLSIAADLSQATRVEWTSDIQMPDEPLAVIRFGAGVRYGGL